ncbi:DUF4235 domain-containing protein [Terracoccus luteus]|uniref:DUF4235 domain-containing protein n=1 Tax=Terracoccus luteus TaxID=53356 RepID=A0A839PWW9_9MICO|nr:DUF4235 domain-containing protein [Terracoccus luteus]MBB2988017.1 hypothetical protein [Terracoccus luteus]MCP2173668.1 hypothetical protein [Terracoccus luteus]
MAPLGIRSRKARPAGRDEKTPAPVKTSPLGGAVWKVLSIVATLGASRLATLVATKGWQAVTGRPVPIQGDYEKERTRDVVAFTALSAMLVTAARIAAERKAADYYRQSTGHLPKALVDARPSRKQRRAARRLEKARSRAGRAVERATSAVGSTAKDAKDAVAGRLPG